MFLSADIRCAVPQRAGEAHRTAGRAAEQLAVAHGDVAADDGGCLPAGDRLALEGRPAAFRLQPGVLDAALRLQVDQGEVAVVADGDAALAGDAIDSLCACGGEIDQELEGEPAGVQMEDRKSNV